MNNETMNEEKSIIFVKIFKQLYMSEQRNRNSLIERKQGMQKLENPNISKVCGCGKSTLLRLMKTGIKTSFLPNFLNKTTSVEIRLYLIQPHYLIKNWMKNELEIMFRQESLNLYSQWQQKK
jgi:ABC-type nitrate/sulfonate/bicarbonate transport system ATPase subunit